MSMTDVDFVELIAHGQWTDDKAYLCEAVGCGRFEYDDDELESLWLGIVMAKVPDCTVDINEWWLAIPAGRRWSTVVTAGTRTVLARRPYNMGPDVPRYRPESRLVSSGSVRIYRHWTLVALLTRLEWAIDGGYVVEYLREPRDSNDTKGAFDICGPWCSTLEEAGQCAVQAAEEEAQRG